MLNYDIDINIDKPMYSLNDGHMTLKNYSKESNTSQSRDSKSSVGLISKSLNGIITGWSKGAEKIFGYNENEIIGEHICSLFPVDRLHEELMIIEKVKKGLVVKDFETVRLRKDGSSIPVSITVTPIKNDVGEVISVSKVVIELSKK